MNIVGFHGTSSEAAKSILTDGFIIKATDDKYLGDGIYFFVEGLSSRPWEQAESWAKINSWDNKNKVNSYDRYSVLESTIQTQDKKVLNLKTSTGVERYQFLVDCYTKNLMKIGKRVQPIFDGQVINFARKYHLMDLDASISDMYIMLTKEERCFYDNRRRICNCTVCVVYSNTKDVITKVELNKEGDVQ